MVRYCEFCSSGHIQYANVTLGSSLKEQQHGFNNVDYSTGCVMYKLVLWLDFRSCKEWQQHKNLKKMYEICQNHCKCCWD